MELCEAEGVRGVFKGACVLNLPLKGLPLQVYVAEVECDPSVCIARNVHKRTSAEIQELAQNWEPTPAHYNKLDLRGFLQSEEIENVDMEDAEKVRNETFIVTLASS